MEQFLIGMFFGAVVTIVIMSLIVISGDRKDKEGD